MKTIETPTITPCLWFDTQAEEAVNFYTSVFPGSGISGTTFYGEGAPLPEGTALTVDFYLDGQQFLALNGGPHFKFTEAVSFVVNCETQQEIDEYWNKLLAGGGKEQVCGWLKDKYGLSWQIFPTEVSKMLQDKDKERAGRVMQEVMRMVKPDLDKIRKAYNGKQPVIQ